MKKAQGSGVLPTGNNQVPTGVLPTGNVPLQLSPHPLASLVPGEMSGEEMAALAVSIKRDGLQVPIVLFEGKILDGRARYQACQEVQVPVETSEFKGKDATSFVLSMNLHRRQLNAMQKGLVGAAMTLRQKDPLTQREASTLVGVGIVTLNLAVRLLASKNTILIKRTERGDMTRAELAELLHEEEPAMTVKPKGNVLSLSNGSGVIGKRRPVVTRPSETAASKMVANYRKLSKAEQKHFVEMALTWLKPALKSLGYVQQAAKAKVVQLHRRKAA